MIIPQDTPDLVQFMCNICGHANSLAKGMFHRELALCANCGSNARFRGIVNVLGMSLGKKSGAVLASWPRGKTIVGMGMSDWPGYANHLAATFSYENTFYDREPRLDIQQIAQGRIGRYDFVISSDVFEHIPPPLQSAFDNLYALLKPGGSLIFSVPYTRLPQTIEHYPGLNEYNIFDFYGKKILVNRDLAGRLQVYDDLVFHGGEGATLELRLFCEADVLDRLVKSGFTSIRVHEIPEIAIGHYWPELRSPDPHAPSLFAYIISAQRPVVGR